MQRVERADRSRTAHPTYLQSRSCKFHPYQTVVDARERAGELAAHTLSNASERLCPAKTDGRTGDGFSGCVGNSDAGRGAAEMVRGSFASGATGLSAGTPVVAGAGDQAAGAVGMGIVTPGAVSATIGTSGVVFAATDRPALDPKGRLHTFRSEERRV